MEVSVVSEALSQLYNPLSSPRMRRRADSLLQNFQRTPEAAQTTLRVLQAPIVDKESPQLKAERAFAASTIYFTVASYVRKYKLENPALWTEDERQQHEALSKEFGVLCQEVWNIMTGPNGIAEEFNVQTHLALTIAVILLRFHEQHSESTIVAAVEWLVQNQVNPIQDDVTSNLTNFAILLTLKVIPEEVENKRVKFSKTKRAQCEVMVHQSAPYVVKTVLPTLARAIDADDKQVRLRGLLLKCFSSWVEYGNVPPTLIMESGLLDRAFQETMYPAFSEDALLVIREVVRACNNNACIPLMELVMKNFVLLGKHIVERLATNDAVGYCLKGCAVAMAECGQSFIMYFVDCTLDLQPGSLVYEFLDTILYFTAMNDLDISNETMNFWIDFRAYISGKHERRIADFEAFISRLLSILIERTEFPDDYESFPAAARERFMSYRNDVRAVFRSLATVTQASEDKFIVDAIHVIFRQYELYDAGHATPTWWKRTEVYVHALSALSKSIREEDTSLIPHLFELLARKEPSHRALLRTVTIFLGVMGHWFARNPSFLSVFAFEIISQSFEIPESHPTFPFRLREEDHLGTVALKKLTHRCGAHFFNQRWLDAMLNLYRTNRATKGTKTACLDGNSLQLIVESVAYVVATVPYKDAVPVIEELCAIMFHDLAARFPTLNADDDECVEFLCVLFAHLHVLAVKIPPQINQEVPHPLLRALQTHWTVIEGILRIFGTTEDVIGTFCGMLVALFDSIRSQALDLAAAIMPHLLEQFTRSFDGSFLNVIKSIIACAGDDDGSMASLTHVLVIVVESALSHLATVDNADESAALIVSLLDLARRCGSQRPVILVRSNQLEALLVLVLHSLKSQNPEVGQATLDFLLEVGSWYGEVLRTPPELLRSSEWEGKLELHQLIRTLFFEKDVQYHLLVALFNAAGGSMPPNLIERVAEVVRSCWVCFGRQRSEVLIHRLLADDGFVGAHVAVRARNEFAGTISKPECIENSRKFKRVLTAFCDHFRKSLNSTNGAIPPTTGIMSS
uniref:Exportin-1/Importin-beta-like domain-containing protein n=1 Tax=Globisporangium ultimum (strain ATCC 200006 / CBS 805.95 / DAOM BR144) TaxID=431595 RepID=K3W788_GLOUD